MKKVIRRRRLENKTDYKARLALLKSDKPRLVVRKSNRYISAQIVKSEVAQDITLASFNSKILISKEWPKELSGSLKSIPAGYLTGFLLGSSLKEELKDKEIILDIGMNRAIPKSRIFAVLKGAIDSGLNIPHDEESLPSLTSLKSNKKLSSMFEKLTGSSTK